MQAILLVEDNLPLQENTCEILELANYKVLTAFNGKHKAWNSLLPMFQISLYAMY